MQKNASSLGTHWFVNRMFVAALTLGAVHCTSGDIGARAPVGADMLQPTAASSALPPPAPPSTIDPAGGGPGTTGAGGMGGSMPEAGGVGGGFGSVPQFDPNCGVESFAAIYRDIFGKLDYGCNTTTCHGRTMGLDAVGNLNMGTLQVAYQSLVMSANSDSAACLGKARVVPKDPANSLLLRKLRAGTLDCGTLMPQGTDPITDVDYQRIATWVQSGACNN